MAKKAGQHTPPRRSHTVIPSPAFVQSGIAFSVCGLSIQTRSVPLRRLLTFVDKGIVSPKCPRNVTAAKKFHRKSGANVTTLGHFKKIFEKSGAAHAAPPIPYGYSIARICSIRDCFFCLRIVHTDKISSIPNNTRMNSPISKTGN